MKIKFIKILASLLLLVAPVTSFTYNANAKNDFISVDPKQINLSKEFILDEKYLNSPKNKSYFLSRIMQSQCLDDLSIQKIISKFKLVEFFTLPSRLHDEQGRIILWLSVPQTDFEKRRRGPKDIRGNIHERGIIYGIPMVIVQSEQ
jgi:hypothetical protein